MAECKSLKELKKFLEKNIEKAIKDKPPKAVKSLMKKHILRDVYMVYYPLKYKRRLSKGGLLDERNILIEEKDSNTVEISNITKRSTVYTSDYTADQMYLAPVIEYGHVGAEQRGYRGYSFPNPTKAYYYPRPFIRNTRESLKRSKSHVKSFQHGLKRLGINTE